MKEPRDHTRIFTKKMLQILIPLISLVTWSVAKQSPPLLCTPQSTDLQCKSSPPPFCDNWRPFSINYSPIDYSVITRSRCEQCSPGYQNITTRVPTHLPTAANLCVKLPPNCEKMNDAETCLKCSHGLNLTTDSIPKCVCTPQSTDSQCKSSRPPFCDNWKRALSIDYSVPCAQCSPGYQTINITTRVPARPPTAAYLCAKLPPNCGKMNNAGTCLKCSHGLKLTTDSIPKCVCTREINNSPCKGPGIMSPKNCDEWEPTTPQTGCSKCSGDFQKINMELMYKGNLTMIPICAKSPFNCKTMMSDGRTCKECSSTTFELKNGQCAVPNCQTTSLLNGTCIACQTQPKWHVLSTETIPRCIEGPQFCNSLSKGLLCNGCVSGYHPVGDPPSCSKKTK